MSQVIAGKLVISVGFLVASVVALLKQKKLALWLSLVLTVVAVAFVADGFGPNARGFLQLSALLLMPFIAVVGTLGDARFAAVSGLAVMLSTQLVAHRWTLTLQDRAICLFIMFLATAVAVAVAAVLGESKRQALHDQRGSQRATRRLAFSQRERSRAERMAVVGQLASTMAHEINNPLAFTLANLRFIAEALRSGAPLDVEELREVLGESQEGLHRIESIVERMSVFRAPARGLQPTDVRQTLAALAQRAQTSSSGVNVVVEAAPDLPAVTLDESRLSRVLKAVVTNSVQALDGAKAAEKGVRISTEATADELRIIVDDDGPGIPETVLPRMFEPFATAAGEGRLGLSLALARELVRSIGGDVRASNRSSGGARVVVSLPVAPPSVSA